MKKLRSNKAFCKLLFANGISRVGDAIDLLAFSWLIYEITGKAAWSALIVGVNKGCSVLLQPFIGSFVERFRKRRTIIITDYCRFLLILLLFFLYRIGFCNKIVLIAFTAIVSFIETFRIPAGVAFLPQILEKENYDRGISINYGISQTSEFIGMFLAGILIKKIGAISSILIDGGTFFISAVIIQTISIHENKVIVEKTKHVIKDMVDGFHLLLSDKQLYLICLTCALINAVVIPYDVLQPAIIKNYFDAEPYYLTAFNVVFSIGMIVGAFFYGLIKIREKRKSLLLIIGGIIIGLFYISISVIINSRSEVLYKSVFMCLQLFIVALAIAIMNSYIKVFFVKNVKQEFLARIAAISASITNLGAPIASFVLSGASKRFNVIELLFGTGIIAIVLFCVSGIFFCFQRSEND